MNKGLIGILGLLIFVICMAIGYFLIQQNPSFKNQLNHEINQVVKEATSDTSNIANPLDLAKDQERRESVKAISDALFNYITGKKGLLPKDFPTQETCIGTDSNCYDLGKILVPLFLDEMPKDPETGNEANTGFTTFKNKENRVVVRTKNPTGGEYEIVR